MTNKNDYPNLIEILNKIGEYIKKTYKDKLESGNNIATGKLKDGVDYLLDLNNNNFKLYFTAPDQYWDKKYTGKLYIEQGRKGTGKMPKGQYRPLSTKFVNSIKEWMIIKPGINYEKGGEYAMARHIDIYGIKPRPYLQEIKNDIENKFLNDIRKAFDEDIKHTIKKQIIIKIK